MAINFPTSLDSLTNPAPTDSRATVSLAGKISDLNDAVEALEAKVGIDSSAVTNSLDYKVANKQDLCEDKTADFTAAVHGNYTVTATLTVTDPTPQSGHGFRVLVRNGTATIGGVAYSVAGTIVERVYHSGAWASYQYKDAAAFAAAGSTTASGLTMSTARILGRSTASTGAIEEISIGSGLTLSAGTLSASGGGGAGGQEFERQRQDGPGVTGLVAQLTARQAVTLSQVTLNPYSLPSGTKEFLTTGNNDNAIGDVSARTRIAMTFVNIASNYSATNISLRIKKVGSPSDNFQVAIHDVSGGLPTTLLSSASYTLPGATVTSSYVDYVFQIPSYTLLGTSNYAIVCTRSGAVDGSNYYQIEGVSSGGTTNDQKCEYNGSSWGTTGAKLRYSVNGGVIYDFWKRSDDTAMTVTDSIATNTFGFGISSLASSRYKAITTGINVTSVSAGDRIQVRCQSEGNTPSVSMEVSLKN